MSASLSHIARWWQRLTRARRLRDHGRVLHVRGDAVVLPDPRPQLRLDDGHRRRLAVHEQRVRVRRDLLFTPLEHRVDGARGIQGVVSLVSSSRWVYAHIPSAHDMSDRKHRLDTRVLGTTRVEGLLILLVESGVAYCVLWVCVCPKGDPYLHPTQRPVRADAIRRSSSSAPRSRGSLPQTISVPPAGRRGSSTSPRGVSSPSSCVLLLLVFFLLCITLPAPTS